MVEHVHRHKHESMLSVEEARERVLGYFDVLEPETRPILEADGQVLAEDVEAHLDIPPLDNSAMDGYALRTEDIRGASEASAVSLRVTGSVAAGQLPSGSVEPGTAIRIMTGAPIPDGADAVVPFEDTDEVDRRASGRTLSEIGIREEVPPTTNVRPSGQDVRAGERVLESGTVLRLGEIGVLAALGRSSVRVIRRPVAAILATGDELVDVGEELRAGSIYDVNSYSVAAAVQRAGGVPRLLGIARDNLDDLDAKLQAGMEADILITSAGVSKGDYDIVRDVLALRGEIELWSVRMRPAKPLAFGVLDGPGGRRVPHLGLPGNPVSALVGFEQIGRPAILKMLGKTSFARPTLRATLEEPIHNFDGRRVYARAIVTRRDGAYYARLTGHQNSNILTSMSRANGLAICPEDVAVKEAGEEVDVQMVDWPEDVF
jgi:molybdopterin molybdotransferase